MNGKGGLIGLLVSALVLGSVPTLGAIPGREDGRDKEVREEIPRISLQVSALQILYLLKTTPEQLQALAKIATATAPRPQPRRKVEISEKYRKTLVELRKVLIEDNEEKISSLTEELKGAQEKEEADLDDAVEVVPPVRKKAADVLKMYSSRQLAMFIGSYGEEFPEPVEKLQAGFEDARMLDDDDWINVRKQLPELLGWLVAGCDSEAAGKVENDTAILLDKVRTLKEAEYARQRPELEAEGKKLVGQVEGTQVLRNFLQRELAELLSNPELPRVLEERLKKVKAEE